MPVYSPIPRARPKNETKTAARAYRNLHREDRGGTLAARTKNYMQMINDYYDLATDFYEFGWGQSFHFAPRYKGEGFRDSLRRHEQFLADQLALRPGMRVLDVGCGVGGPMREIARYSGAHITGVNNNAYQLKKCTEYNRKAGLDGLCDTLQTDFMKIPATTKKVDAIYAIEATCHAPDKAALFKKLYGLLKPGGMFAGYEWCLTDKFEPHNLKHQRIKKGIEEGDALPDIAPTWGVDEALKAAGFEILVARDKAHDADPGYPWYRSLQGRDLTWSSLPRTPLGGKLTYAAVQVLERVGLAPEGTSEVSNVLQTAATHLVAGGKLGVFTPMYYFCVRKPG